MDNGHVTYHICISVFHILYSRGKWERQWQFFCVSYLTFYILEESGSGSGIGSGSGDGSGSGSGSGSGEESGDQPEVFCPCICIYLWVFCLFVF